MRVLAVSAQLPGHLDWGGYMATAATLHARGHSVLWASGAAVAPQVGRAGLPFHALTETGWRWPPPPPLPENPGMTPHALLLAKQLRALDQWLDPARVAAATVELLDLARDFQPDLILTEMFVSAAGIAAEVVGCPLVVMGWPAPVVSPPRPAAEVDLVTRSARQRLDDLLTQFGASGVHFSPSGPPSLNARHGHITYWSPGWYGDSALGAQTVHFGGLRREVAADHRPDPTLPAPDDAPWVLITLGTSFNADPNFFVAAAHATANLGCLPLIALGAPLDAPWVAALKGRLPRGAVVRPLLDFARVLPAVSAAVHHGGAGTTHALVTHAVPQIIVPHAADQMRQAQGVQRSGAGVMLPAKQVTLPRLEEALAQALADRGPLRTQAQALQAEFHALGGVPAAATWLEALDLG